MLLGCWGALPHLAALGPPNLGLLLLAAVCPLLRAGFGAMASKLPQFPPPCAPPCSFCAAPGFPAPCLLPPWPGRGLSATTAIGPLVAGEPGAKGAMALGWARATGVAWGCSGVFLACHLGGVQPTARAMGHRHIIGRKQNCGVGRGPRPSPAPHSVLACTPGRATRVRPWGCKQHAALLWCKCQMGRRGPRQLFFFEGNDFFIRIRI